MSTANRSRWLCSVIAAALMVLLWRPGFTQDVEELGGALDIKSLFKDADIGSGALSEPDPRVSATLRADGEMVTLSIRLELPEGGNTYSQDPSFAKPTKIELHNLVGLSPVDEQFSPDHAPKRLLDENFGKEVEKYYGVVTWTRRFRILSGAVPSRIAVTGAINFLYCKESCRPLELPFRATLGGTSAESAAIPSAAAPSGVDDLAPPPIEDLSPPPPVATVPATGPFQSAYRLVPQYNARAHANGDPVAVEFQLDHPPGSDTAVLAITLHLGPKYHVYGVTRAPGQPKGLGPTVIEIRNTQGLQPVSKDFAPLTPPLEHVEDLAGEPLRYLYHEHSVVWTRVFRTQPGASPGVSGVMTFQVCNDQTCLNPQTVEFSLGSLQEAADVDHAVPATALVSSKDRTAALALAGLGAPQSPASVEQIAFEDTSRANSLATWLLFAFLGGLILNVMPCVLPVISIKILSFVQQAGEHPGRILLLNVVYALGVLTVFLVLATLAITLKLGWGEQNQSAVYNIVMIGIVFTMGLSLLGVFEIPIPGMLSSGIGGAEQREGPAGAYLTGIIATLLATPCTGPFMGAALSWALEQPNHIIFAVFSLMGLGMASPYLLIGCFPKLIDWLPRPGQWMVTFKQFCGFILMGTVVWLLNTVQGINVALVTPTLIILVGLGLFVWMVGQLYDLSSSRRQVWTVRVAAVLLAGPILFLGGNWAHAIISPPDLAQTEHAELPWQPFSDSKFRELIQAGKPVLVDFTADYCVICKANERLALNTKDTAAFVRENGFVTLVADFTQGDAEIRRWLEFFKNPAVPLTIVVPAGNPAKTKLLRSAYFQSDLLRTLEEAVRDGKPVGAEATAATPRDQTVSLN